MELNIECQANVELHFIRQLGQGIGQAYLTVTPPVYKLCLFRPYSRAPFFRKLQCPIIYCSDSKRERKHELKFDGMVCMCVRLCGLLAPLYY